MQGHANGIVGSEVRGHANGTVLYKAGAGPGHEINFILCEHTEKKTCTMLNLFPAKI